MSALDSSDPSRENSLETLRKPDKVVSELVIAELNSVVLRNKNFVKLRKELKGELSSSIYAVIIYVLERFDLLYLPAPENSIEVPIGKYNGVMALAIELAIKVPMKTLDLLHLAYAFSLSKSNKSNVEFVTRDRGFRDYNREINEAIGITINYIV